ncbi:HAD family hydrolase [Desulfuribacillus stibiiarsenatis]|uniref:Acid sugar phosphatase n=1 Tax=Desulfuribacillus stibiiarsenatis TaxID=1390249 RepID=A0A1E5L561_9FIRM|nr:HAD family hydrolase [Desulfuribacillus stibiiarsenatis]
MKKYQGYLLDLDGTIYRGTEPIPEAIEFVKRLQERNIPFLFLTNNSSKTQLQVAEKLNSYGLTITVDHVYTSSMAAARFLVQENQHERIRAYVIGEEGMIQAVKSQGIQITEDNPSHVVMGIDRHINYEKLATACLAIRNGAKLLATNLDRAIPTERGLLPGNGSIVSVVTTSTGIEPIVVGKPMPIITQYALEKLGVAKDLALMVGDNYETDICTGFNAGMDTLLVFTGFTSKEDLQQKDRKPTYCIDSLNQWIL